MECWARFTLRFQNLLHLCDYVNGWYGDFLGDRVFLRLLRLILASRVFWFIYFRLMRLYRLKSLFIGFFLY